MSLVPSSLVAADVHDNELALSFPPDPPLQRSNTDGVLSSLHISSFENSLLLLFLGMFLGFVLAVCVMLMYRTCSRAINYSDSPRIRAETGPKKRGEGVQIRSWNNE
jgi:hypothetical protein